MGGLAIIDVNGVGYEVSLALRDAPSSGAISVIVATLVRDDAITLVGFATLADRELFDALRSVQGIGPSMAIALLRYFGGDELRGVLAAGNVTALTSVSGVGQKTAQRLVNELGDKVGPGTDVTVLALDSTVVEALVSLGYSRSEIASHLEGVTLADDESSALRQALNILART
jgi:Holliday junction DNA helicase RuvA